MDFAGHSWTVKASTGAVGPGPNVFSDSAANVRTDPQGRLHLSIVARAGMWTCAEVINRRSLGYGTYRWTIDGDLTTLDPAAVLGMFTWSDDPAHAHRELDVEFSRWGNAAALRTGWHTIQTGQSPSPLSNNFQMRSASSSTHSIAWSAGRVGFRSSAGGRTHRWTRAAGRVPVPGDESARINLWLFQGRAPEAASVDVVVRDFSFQAGAMADESRVALTAPAAGASP